MKQTWNRLVAMVLCLSLTLTMLPARAAASPSDGSDGNYESLETNNGGTPENESGAAPTVTAPENEGGEETGEGPISPQADGDTYPITGNCGINKGNNLTWSLDANGTLTISGTGMMEDCYFTDGDSQPWKDYREEIKSVTVGAGCTDVGRKIFMNCANLQSVTLGSDVATIGEEAFRNCTSLETVQAPAALTKIGTSASNN